MIEENQLISLLKKRIQLYTELKKILFKEQKTIHRSNTEEYEKLKFIEMSLLNEIKSNEKLWKKFIIHSLNTNCNNTTYSNVNIIRMLNEKTAIQYLAYQDQLQSSFKDIIRIRKNKFLLPNFPLTLSQISH